MTLDKPKGRRAGAPGFPQETIDHALLALAYTGTAKHAHEQLVLAGISPVPSERTIREWRQKYSGRLAEMREKHGAEIERHIVSGYLEIVRSAQDKVLNSMEAADEAIQLAKDSRMITALSGAARNFATIYGITQDKIHVIHGKPTTIVGKEKSAEESLRSLADRFGRSVDSTTVQLEEGK